MMFKYLKRSLFFILACASLAGCNESPQENNKQLFQQPFQSMLVYPKKNKIGDFKLIKHDLSEFNQSQFSGKWNLLFIGYTNCPDVCPTTLADISNIYKKIKPELQTRFQLIFLSVDPARDNPQHIAQYIDYFHDDLVGVTGDKTELDKLVASLGGIYSLNTDEGEYYTVDHTARIFIVDPEGQRYGIISSESMHNKDKTLLVKELEIMAQPGL